MSINITNILEESVKKGASDIILTIGANPHIRISGVLSKFSDYPKLSLDDLEHVLHQLLDKTQYEIFEVNKEIDFSIGLGNKARVRVNAFHQKGYPAIALRIIPLGAPVLEDLNLPKVVEHLCTLRQGLILVVGPTGHGKSTTIAGMLQRINETRSEHIITLEDPIEYMFSNDKSLFEQRELYLDTNSWDVALKSTLRQDPNIVMVGEMRDTETIDATLRLSETGNLVMASLHTNSAAQTVDRILSSFSQDRRTEIGLLLSATLEAVISQRLVKGKDGKLYPAAEVMLASEAIRSLIRENKTFLLDNIITTSSQSGMITLEQSLADLVNKDLVSFEEALKYTSNPQILKRLIK